MLIENGVDGLQPAQQGPVPSIVVAGWTGVAMALDLDVQLARRA